MSVSVVLFSSKGSVFAKLVSSLISWFEDGSRITHAGIGLNIDGVPHILHATWPKVVLVPRSQVLQTHNVVAEFEVIPDISNEIEIAEKKVGEPYSLLTLFGYIAVVIGKYLGIGIDNPLACKSSCVCSEFVIEADSKHEILEFDGIDPADITPADLYFICADGKSFRRIV